MSDELTNAIKDLQTAVTTATEATTQLSDSLSSIEVPTDALDALKQMQERIKSKNGYPTSSVDVTAGTESTKYREAFATAKSGMDALNTVLSTVNSVLGEVLPLLKSSSSSSSSSSSGCIITDAISKITSVTSLIKGLL